MGLGPQVGRMRNTPDFLLLLHVGMEPRKVLSAAPHI